MDERELTERSKRGDLSAFNLLVERYQTQVYNLALRILGDMSMAEDATQEAFLSAWRGIRSFRGGSLRAWLLRITSNACYDQVRAARRRPTVSLETLLDPEEPNIPGGSESPEEYALRRELGRTIQQGLASLPFEQRLVVVLSDIQGLSYEEIAQATHTSLGTVKSRLSRGRAGLRDCLRELLPERHRP